MEIKLRFARDAHEPIDVASGSWINQDKSDGQIENLEFSTACFKSAENGGGLSVSAFLRRLPEIT
jgi:hypothetical protein